MTDTSNNCENTIFDPICVYDPAMKRIITYPNICYVRLVNKFRRKDENFRSQMLSVRNPGICKSKTCPEGTGSVCSTNFETFPTLCDLKNSNRKFRCMGNCQQYLCNNCGDLTDPENVEPVCAKASYKYIPNRQCSACDKERVSNEDNCNNLKTSNYELTSETDYNSATNDKNINKRYTYLNNCELQCASEEIDYFQAGGCDSLSYAVYPGIFSTDNYFGISSSINNLGITSVVLGTDGNWYFDALTCKYAGTRALNVIDFGGAEQPDGGFNNLPYNIYLSLVNEKVTDKTVIYDSKYFFNQTITDFLKITGVDKVPSIEMGQYKNMFKFNFLLMQPVSGSDIRFVGISKGNLNLFIWVDKSIDQDQLIDLFKDAIIQNIPIAEWPNIESTKQSEYLYNKRCEDNCPNNDVVVCGTDNNTYKNSCFAQCNNAGVQYYGKCKNRCLDADYDPVCGDDGINYWNSCAAEFKGTSYTRDVVIRVIKLFHLIQGDLEINYLSMMIKKLLLMIVQKIKNLLHRHL